MSFSAARCCAVSRQLSISSATLTLRISSSNRSASILRKLQQVVGEPGQAARMLQDDSQEALAVLRIVDRAGQQRFREALNGGQRRLEFMRYVGHKIAPHALELAQFRDVVQHHDRAGSFPGAHRSDRRRKKMLAQRAGHDLGFDARLSRQDLANAPQSFPSAALPRPARSPTAAAHPVPKCRQSSDSRRPAVRRRSRPRRLPPCCPESPTTGCAPRSAFGSCDPSAWPFDSARLPALQAHRRNRPPGSGRKSPSATRRENSLQALHAVGKAPRHQHRRHPRHQQNHKRRHPQASAKRSQYLIGGFQGNREPQYDRRASGLHLASRRNTGSRASA